MACGRSRKPRLRLGSKTKKLQQAISQSRLSVCSFFWRVQLFECNPATKYLGETDTTFCKQAQIGAILCALGAIRLACVGQRPCSSWMGVTQACRPRIRYVWDRGVSRITGHPRVTALGAPERIEQGDQPRRS